MQKNKKTEPKEISDCLHVARQKNIILFKKANVRLSLKINRHLVPNH